MKQSLKTALAALMSIVVALTVMSVLDLSRFDAKAEVTQSWTVPAGYNAHDYNKCAEFLEQTDEDGVKNGAKLSSSYDPNDPKTWGTNGYHEHFEWIIINGEHRIRKIRISEHRLSANLYLSGCTALEVIVCEDNALTALDISDCTALTDLFCQLNNLTDLKISNCIALVQLDCSQNNLIRLDVSGCTSLCWLKCDNNNLSKLNISNCIALEMLSFYNNNLAELNASNCTSLKKLGNVSNGVLTKLDISGCTAIEELKCYNNNLTELDVTSCTAIKVLWCDNNNLATLNVSGCTALESLQCNNNSLNELDVSRNTALKLLNCSNNKLTELNISRNSILRVLSCGNNSLSVLNVSQNITLEYLNCENNSLTEIDLSRNTALIELTCENNTICELDVSHCNMLQWLICGSNRLATLDLRNNPQMPLFNYFFAEGDGGIGYSFYYDAPFVISAYPMKGAIFEGFYDESGALISTGEWNDYEKAYVYEFASTPKFNTIIARFSGNTAFQHTIKSHPDEEDRDFTFEKNEEVEQLVLSTSASQYNPRLANFLAVMARSAYNEELVKSNYEKLGISVSFNNSFDFANIEATYVVGKKQLVNDSYIVFITIRGSYGLSWVTDFAPGTALNFGGWHDGFEFCVSMLHKNIEDSFGGKIPTNARYVITGHSLGAAVGNLLATKLNEDGVPMNFVYAYNFACPDVANDWDWAWNHNGEHNNIFNIGCCQDPVTFVPGALADYFSWPWLFWGKYGQNVWFSENWNNLDKLMLDPYSHDMKTYVDYMAKERPFSEFRSYSEVFTSIIGNQLRTILGILCPVDVTVKNSNGDKLLSIIGDKVEYFGISPEDVIVCFNGDEKCIVLPDTDDVTIEFLATGDGAMTYTAAKVNLATREVIDSMRFSNVPLIAGKTFSSSVSGGETSSNVTLLATDVEGNIIERIQPDGESVVPVTSEPSVQPSGENEIITSAPDNKESNEIDSNHTGSNVLLIAVIAVAVLIITVAILLTAKAKSMKNSKNERR